MTEVLLHILTRFSDSKSMPFDRYLTLCVVMASAHFPASRANMAHNCS